MLRTNRKFSESSLLRTSLRNKLALIVLLATSTFLAAGCDRGASEREQAALKFADAVARNEQAQRDSMIATGKFKEYFQNQYVAAEMIDWFRGFYDYQGHHFVKKAKVDVDRDLTKELEGALIDTNKVEESGVVMVPSPTESSSRVVILSPTKDLMECCLQYQACSFYQHSVRSFTPSSSLFEQ